MKLLTAVAPEKEHIPLAFASDRGALEAAFKTIGLWTPSAGVRVAWIANTRDLEVLAVSSALFERARAGANWRFAREPGCSTCPMMRPETFLTCGTFWKREEWRFRAITP